METTAHNRKRRRLEAKQRTTRKRKQHLQPVANSWAEIHILFEQWQIQCNITSKNITICSSCGVSYFSRIRPVKNQSNNDLVKLASTTFLDAADKESVTVHWTNCSSCANKPRSANVVVLLPDYTRRILNSNQLHTQMLSIIDVSIIVNNTANAVASGLLDKRSLLDNPLICWTNEETLRRMSNSIATSQLSDILAFNLLNNPIIKKYKTIAEQPHKKASLCVLSTDVIEGILTAHSESEPFDLMERAEAHCDISILENMYVTSRRKAYTTADTHEFGSIKLREGSDLIERTATFRYNGLPSSASEANDITIETAMFPFLFPFGHGNYQGDMNFSDYINMRIGTLFSVYTLYKPYLLMMYQLKQAIMIANSTTSTMLQRDIDAFKRKNKNTSTNDAIRNVIRYNLPSTMPGTPSWHRRNLRDLIAMVDTWGLPDLFLTFTADEVTDTRWDEFSTIETLAQAFNTNYSWKDCPVECALLFHNRLHNFLSKYIFAGKKLLGDVEHHLIRYEIQNRGSLHAHIILWISKNDIEQTTSEIAAYIPVAHEHEFHFSNKLRGLVLSKQIHRCRPACKIVSKNSICKYGFPFKTQMSKEPTLDPQTLRWLYYRPGYEHRNVVPYHPTIMLLWGAHMNIQRVTNSSISRYLLKYAMKAEPITKLNLSSENAKKLGLHGLDKLKLSVIAASIMSKPISATEAAVNCMKIPIVTRSEAVEFIETSPASIRKRLVTRNQTIVMHPIDLYCARPQQYEHYTFCEYHKTFKVEKNTAGTNSNKILDALNNVVFECRRLVRFTEFHPGHSTEAFFFNVLLQRITFRNESQIFSAENSMRSYYRECEIRQLINSEEDLEMYINQYTQRNMLLSENNGHIMSLIQQKLILNRENPLTIGYEETPDTTEKSRHNMLLLLKEFSGVLNAALTSDQQSVFEATSKRNSGLVIITGIPGSGKSFLIKYLTASFIKQNKSVILTASTGAAASRLSSIAKTVHYQFKITTGSNQHYPDSIEPTDDRFIEIKEADVIVIDEISMLTSSVFDVVVRQIVDITNGTLHDPFSRKLVMLFGDLAQLPPVCNHDAMLCESCIITQSAHISHGIVYNMSFSVRHVSDPAFLDFLQVIRHRKPTEQEIYNTLLNCVVNEEQLLETIDDKTTIICTHREDVHRFNDAILQRSFPEHEIVRVDLDTNANDIPSLQRWVNDTKFNEIDKIAINAKCMITFNVDLTIGAANGATCRVQNIRRDKGGKVKAIEVKLDSTGQTTIIKRCKHANTAIDLVWYHKNTFPLTLAYAITGHKSQGATISEKAVINIKEAFSPGLAYVMFSRVTDRRHLKILQLPTPDMFTPMRDLLSEIML